MWNRTTHQIELTLIRHGAAKANEQHRYLGKTDEPLSEKGREELMKKKQEFAIPQMLFCSPMLRCRQTAEILFGDMQPQLIPEWTEMDFGDFEGKDYQELAGNADYQAWIDSNGTLPFPNGESREAFTARSLRGLKRMVELAGECRSVAAVVHGGTIMALASHINGGEYFDYQVGNGCACHLILEDWK